jgi:predicted metal-dependent hydrolase
MPQMTVGSMKIDVVRKNIKNLHLAVYPPKGRVRVASPLGVTDEAIRLFVISRMSWIKKQQRRFLEQERETDREFVARESHYFFGKRYLLNIIETDKFPKVVLNKSFIDLYVRAESGTEKRQSIMNEWYRRELKKRIPELLEKWEEVVGVTTSDWGVKLMKTKWGACNREERRIWLNLELAKKPVSCLEYIIVHELVHFLERRHNDVFLQYMDSSMPHWKSIKQELNRLPVSHASWSY